MKAETIKGFAVSRGKIVQREVFTSRKAAAAALDPNTAKGKRGFAVRYGRVVETLTTPSRSKRRGSGRLRHQEIGGDGQAWEDWNEPLTSRKQAQRQIVKDLRRRLASTRTLVRQLNNELAKATK